MQRTAVLTLQWRSAASSRHYFVLHSTSCADLLCSPSCAASFFVVVERKGNVPIRGSSGATLSPSARIYTHPSVVAMERPMAMNVKHGWQEYALPLKVSAIRRYLWTKGCRSNDIRVLRHDANDHLVYAYTIHVRNLDRNSHPLKGLTCMRDMANCCSTRPATVSACTSLTSCDRSNRINRSCKG
jgi:hypothetical protein